MHAAHVEVADHALLGRRERAPPRGPRLELADDARELDLVEQRRRGRRIDLVDDAAEKAKIELSSVKESEINLPFIFTLDSGEALHLQRTLTREKLEELVEDLVQRTLKICLATR